MDLRVSSYSYELLGHINDNVQAIIVDMVQDWEREMILLEENLLLTTC